MTNIEVTEAIEEMLTTNVPPSSILEAVAWAIDEYLDRSDPSVREGSYAVWTALNGIVKHKIDERFKVEQLRQIAS